MKTDGKISKEEKKPKKLTNQIQEHIKSSYTMIKGNSSPGCSDDTTICKSINTIHHSKRIKYINIMIILIHREKHLTKLKIPFDEKLSAN